MVTWYSVPVAMMAAVSAYVGAYHYFLYARRKHTLDLYFALTCGLMATYDLAAFLIYNGASSEASAPWQRLQYAAIMGTAVTFLAFVREYAGLNPPLWIKLIEYSFAPLALLVGFNVWHLALTDTPVVRIVSTPLGEVTYREMSNGPLVNILAAGIPLLAGYVCWASLTRRGLKTNSKRRRTQLVAASILLYIGLGIDALAQQQVINSVYVTEYAWGGLLLLMSWTLSDELVDAESTRRRLVETERRIAVAHDAIQDALITTDLTGTILEMNRAAQRMLATPLAAARGIPLTTLAEITPPDSTTPVRDPIRYALGRPQDPYGPLPRLVTIDGHDRRVDVGGAPLLGSGGRVEGAVIVLRDLTVQHHAIESLRHAKTIESVGQLAGGVAHDLNNLLTPIISYVDLMTRSNITQERQALYLGHVQEAALRAASLTRQLLAVSRKQVLDVQVISLVDLVRKSAPILERLAGESISVIYALDERTGNVQVDAGQMEQAILNLVSNARDAMPTGGDLRITVRSLTGNSVNLQVSDSGSGMGRETMTRIFEPFFTTKPRGLGTGLGLASVKGIVEQHGGSVLVDSELNVGTTFDIILPAADAQSPVSVRTAPPPSELPGGHETLLIVEDDPAVRATMQDTLAQLGYRILLADGLGAALLRQEEEEPDLLICDVVMPGADGPRVRDALTQHREIPCLFVTGHADDRLGDRGIITAGTDVLRKPFSAAALAETVRAVLDRKPTKRTTSGIDAKEATHAESPLAKSR
jgi:signal transduction histidine kinase/CheY-like chemotaxis protein